MKTPTTSSGSQAVGTNVITARPAILKSVILNPSAAAASVIIYDNATAASGTVLVSILAVLSGSSTTWQCDDGVVANNGLVAVVAGTGATAILHYIAE